MISASPFVTLSNTRLSKLVSQQLVGMLIIVLVRKELRPFFSGGKTDYVSAGIGGVLVRDYSFSFASLLYRIVVILCLYREIKAQLPFGSRTVLHPVTMVLRLCHPRSLL